MARVDLNCDMGESHGAWTMGHDADVLPFVSSVNIACGFHAGDPTVMRTTVRAAAERGVCIGAHPGLPDLLGFGRREMAVSVDDVYDMTVYQVGALRAVCTAAGAKMQHVKPHGALYNMAAVQPALADAIARAVRDVDAALILVGLSGSALLTAGATCGLRTASEVFADRHYRADGTLVPRSHPAALIVDAERSAARAVQMALTRTVTAIDGTDVPVSADTICIHGDAAGAPILAARIRAALELAGVAVAAISAPAHP